MKIGQVTSISHMDVSENSGFPPKSSIFIGFSIINHPFWGTTIFGNTHILRNQVFFCVTFFRVGTKDEVKKPRGSAISPSFGEARLPQRVSNIGLKATYVLHPMGVS